MANNKHDKGTHPKGEKKALYEADIKGKKSGTDFGYAPINDEPETKAQATKEAKADAKGFGELVGEPMEVVDVRELKADAPSGDGDDLDDDNGII